MTLDENWWTLPLSEIMYDSYDVLQILTIKMFYNTIVLIVSIC